ncbi:hypothetical protein M406DRAFT_246835 [Cryphonectria parasitica EP155]|uniref:2EXR domain-containing protein n=1 Tax=Cryphonectria parasitica (strain ATCC 38755 / EP155) TaxID=660469 RepID=A0A9P4YB48_CRYP1|nr:uncharacterized protein M406DRAFT_246835 [Cryphonectria parasitica EP155]KAF3769808.1 hypothetical protein M406DRAFT_246835 [Cryphonectria parasitica EP155]
MEFSFLNDEHFHPSTNKISPGPCLEARFARFPDLPIELRLKIWELALPRQRLLTLDIVAADPASGPVRQESTPATYQALNALGNVVSGANYSLRMRSTGSVTPLLRVNRDANMAVCRFYRVCMPINGRGLGLGGGGGGGGGGTPCLRFCPKTDTIHLQIEDHGQNAYFADVVHDASAYDPLGVGILHMAIGGHLVPEEIRLPLDPSSLYACAQAAVSRTLGNLHSISLLHISRGESRRMFSSLLYSDVRFNRSMPVWSTASSFSILPSDPRPIDQDVEKVCLGYDPRMLVCAWRAMEVAFAVSPVPASRMRILAAAPPIASPDPHDIASREDACRFRATEEAAWERNFKQGGVYQEFGHLNPDTENSLERARTMNAVGFWVLPLELIGNICEVQNNHPHEWAQRVMVNLTGVQPPLGLFEMAGETNSS